MLSNLHQYSQQLVLLSSYFSNPYLSIPFSPSYFVPKSEKTAIAMHYGLSTQIRHISLKWEEVDMAEGVVKKKFLERENKGYLNWCAVTFASQEQKWFIMKLFSANMTFTVKFLLRNSSFLVLNIIIAFAQAILQKLIDGVAELSGQFRDVFKILGKKLKISSKGFLLRWAAVPIPRRF